MSNTLFHYSLRVLRFLCIGLTKLFPLAGVVCQTSYSVDYSYAFFIVMLM